jgi:hypothetical protein
MTWGVIFTAALVQRDGVADHLYSANLAISPGEVKRASTGKQNEAEVGES